jgi:serine/threonine protein kinase
LAAEPGASPPSDDRPTETIRWIGQYRVVEEIGRGAGGIVYRALDPAIGREVAIKELRLSRLAPDEISEARQRFVREARAVGNLRHANIVTLYQFIEQKDSLYLVMELVPGGSLHNLIRDNAPLKTGEVAGIVRQVAAALDHAHANAVVHRDIKPGNILVSNDRDRNGPVVKVTDFGIAQISSQVLTMTGVSLGTPAYMAPEQIKASKVDAKADQFSLGVVAYELLSRELPFNAPDPHGLMYQIVNAEAPSLLAANPDLPVEVDRVIGRALAKNPDRRFASCGEFAEALDQALSPSAMPTMRTVRPKSGSNSLYIAIACALLVVAAVAFFGWRSRDRHPANAPPVQVAKIAGPNTGNDAEKNAAEKKDAPPDRADTAPDTSPAETVSPANSEEPAAAATVKEVLCVFPGCKGKFVVSAKLTTDKNHSRIAATLTNRTDQAIESANFTITVKRHGFLKGLPGLQSRQIQFKTGPLMPGESSPEQSFPRQGISSEKWSDPAVPTAKFKALPAASDTATGK